MPLTQILDDVLNRQWIDDDSMGSLRQCPRNELLTTIQRRFADTDSVTVQGNIFDICANVLGTEAGPWIRELSAGPISNMIALPFFRALAKCLGDEGFEIATAKLANEYENQLPLTAHALLEFDSKSQILDWIEQRLHSPNQPTKPDWGQLAAITGITWERIARWLDRGKPLSLVALDALNFCWNYDAGIGAWLHNHEPKLLTPADPDTMRARLQQYAEDDPSPRVDRTVKMIVEHLHETYTA